MIPSVAASERGTAKPGACSLGLWDVSHGVTKEPVKRRGLERPAKEGKSPVIESLFPPRRIPSSAGHVKPRMNPAGPSAKAKYFLATDSEAVP